MLQNESKVKIVDNTGWRTGKVIRILKGSFPRFATIWDKVVIAINSASPDGQVSKWDVSWGVVVRTVKEVRRKDWSYIRFWDNAVALINKEWWARWKRIFWPVAKELREKWYRSLASMAEEVI